MLQLERNFFFFFLCIISLRCVPADDIDYCKASGSGPKCTCANSIMDCRNQEFDSFPTKISEDIKAIYLDTNAIWNISQIPEESELQTLSLTHNKIKALSYDAFDNLDNLQTLILSFNSITTIADDIFEWNPLNLQVLYLDNNQMEFIQHFLFYDLEKLTELYLQNNNITFIHPHAFLQLKNLRRLRLDGNKLHTFSHKWVEKLKTAALVELRFDNNPWSCDCAMVDAQKWLTKEKKSKWFNDLTTDHNLICMSPNDIKGMNVTSVSNETMAKHCDKPVIKGISSNATIKGGRDVLLRCVVDTKKYPVPTLSWTAPNGDVYRLNTADNFEGITVHQDGSLLIEKLKASDKGAYTCTASNKMGSFSANTFIKIEGSVTETGTQQPKTMESVAPKHSETADVIKRCPKDCQCISRHIDCAGDGTKSFTSVPANIPEDAVTLSLALNGLTKIEARTFKNFGDMEEIRMDNNKISDIDSNAFEGLAKLSTLTLRENHLTRIRKRTFVSLTRLKVLVLDKNKLTKLDDAMFKGLESVQWLYIRENLIQTISDHAFTPLKDIKFIHLENNALQVLYPKPIQQLFIIQVELRVQKIFVDDNPFHCDCNLEELRVYVGGLSSKKGHEDLFADGVICQFPSNYSGKELASIKQPLQCEKYISNVSQIEPSSNYSGLLFGGVALGVILTIVLFIMWRKYGRRMRTGGRSYNYSNLNGTDTAERSALTADGLGTSGTEAFV